MSSTVPVITFDGPSGAGKGTVAKSVSNHFKWHYLDSGALYRILAYAAVHADVALSDEPALVALLDTIEIEFTKGAARLNGVAIEQQIRNEKAGNLASKIALHPGVRRALLRFQREFRKAPGLVADGRDMGTVVFADAAYKFYLTASAEERAKRRYKQLIELGHDANIGALFREIEERDSRDQGRIESPLVPAQGAVVIDTSASTAKQVMDQVLGILPESF